MNVCGGLDRLSNIKMNSLRSEVSVNDYNMGVAVVVVVTTYDCLLSC